MNPPIVWLVINPNNHKTRRITNTVQSMFNSFLTPQKSFCGNRLKGVPAIDTPLYLPTIFLTWPIFS